MLDLWFERVVKKSCRGEACLIRYADDYVCAFEAREEAERFYGALEKRLGNLFGKLNQKLRGYYNDDGVHGNSARLGVFPLHAMGILFKWLNRRSDRRSYN